MKTLRGCLLFLCVLSCAPFGRAVGLALDNGAVAIDTGAAGRFLLPAPEYVAGGKALKANYVEDPDGSIAATYANGFVLRVALVPEAGEIRYSFPSPMSGEALKFMLVLPIGFSQGGRYAFSGDPWSEFPATFVGQLLVHGEAQSVSILAPGGPGFSVEAPVGWQAVQDNRKWKWQAFAWVYNYDFKKVPERREFTLKFATIQPPAAPAPK